MEIKPIKTEADYLRALHRVNEIFDAEPQSALGDELEILSVLIERYEDRNFPIEPLNPLDAIKYRMDQLNMRPVDLAKIIGYKSRVSELFSGKRKLSLPMIRQISKALQIPTDLLIREY